MFCRYSLRTTDIGAARDFYRRAIDLELPPNGASPTSSLEGWPLHERARARGAPPHWLGHIAVDDLEATVRRLVELGSELLGPIASTNDGVRFAILRDPFAAVLAVRTGGKLLDDVPVAWHQLHTRDLDGAVRTYSELFGWVPKQIIEADDPGGHRLFAWREPGEAVGMMGNTARRPGIHTHWLFYFPVEDLKASVERVRALGGSAMEPVELTGSLRLSACEDPQGAAFGLAEHGQESRRPV